MGFPSPAEDFKERNLDLNRFLIDRPSSTFFMKAANNMEDAGVSTGDILIIDRSLGLYNNDLAVCYIEGEFVLKRVLKAEKNVWLITDKENCNPIQITKDNDACIWGVVKCIIKILR